MLFWIHLAIPLAVGTPFETSRYARMWFPITGLPQNHGRMYFELKRAQLQLVSLPLISCNKGVQIRGTKKEDVFFSKFIPKKSFVVRYLGRPDHSDNDTYELALNVLTKFKSSSATF